ncbi:hypothetical protein L596_029356 [Steinernema carpocapsae]|uniref:Cytochrome P450 n=1 Tax=Steinernema carpocapsae TaxID=34508 RepID=A0A4U5LUE1_STECR|nr:hypothetical protein L596_029356 [Steinernema carpocapsae]
MSPLYVLWAAVVLVYYVLRRVRQSLPPGPTPFPILGNAHQFLIGTMNGKSNVDIMREWAKIYGNVYTIWLGPMPVVLICDYQTVMDAFVKNGEAHAGRPTTFVTTKCRNGFMGLIFNEGPDWQDQRRFSLHTLRNFGFGRNIMQVKIMEEAKHRFEVLEKQIDVAKDGKLVMNPAPFFDILIGSIVNKLLAGYRYDESNLDEFISLKHSLDVVMDIFNPLDFVIFNRFTYQLPLLKQRWDFLNKPVDDIMGLMKKQINDRQEAIASGKHVLDLNSEGDDYIDAYLIEMEKRKQKGQELGQFCVDNLVTNLFDLWGAGLETTISTLLWACIYMLNTPGVQEKAREEIYSVTQGNRDVDLQDKASLPYVSALVSEALRCGNVLSFNLLHKTTSKTVVGDYLIPKGTVITSQHSVIMTNDDNFKDAEKFNPDRFLEGNSLEKQVIPFGVGKRSCVGESLARVELFLILANFLQRFKITPAVDETPPSKEPISLVSLTKRVKPYEMTVERVSQT